MKSLIVNSFSRSELAETDVFVVGVENSESTADIPKIKTGGQYSSGYIGKNLENLPFFSKFSSKLRALA